jgi:hypothetical protein
MQSQDKYLDMIRSCQHIDLQHKSSLEQLFSFFEGKGYQLTDKDFPPKYFSNYYFIFSNGQLEFRILNDRGCESLEICSVKSKENWCSISSIRSLLKNEKIIIHRDKNNLLAGSFIDDDIEFLFKHYDVIVCLFSEENYEQTLTALDVRAQKWIRQFLGDNAFIEK